MKKCLLCYLLATHHLNHTHLVYIIFLKMLLLIRFFTVNVTHITWISQKNHVKICVRVMPLFVTFFHDVSLDLSSNDESVKLPGTRLCGDFGCSGCSLNFKSGVMLCGPRWLCFRIISCIYRCIVIIESLLWSTVNCSAYIDKVMSLSGFCWY